MYKPLFSVASCKDGTKHRLIVTQWFLASGNFFYRLGILVFELMAAGLFLLSL